MDFGTAGADLMHIFCFFIHLLCFNIDQDRKVNINTPEAREIILSPDQTDYYIIPNTYAASTLLVQKCLPGQQLSSSS